MIVNLSTLSGLCILLLAWYRRRRRPLSQEELESFLSRIQAESGEEGQPEIELLEQLRELCKSDDGKEFYLVNLIRYNKDEGAQLENKKYRRAMMPLLLRRACHPVFLSSYMGRFIHPEGNDDWDDVAVVRYRSRRDMLEVIAEAAKRKLVAAKGSATEKTQAFPVKAKLRSVPIFEILVLALLIFAAQAIYILILLSGV